MLLLMLQQCGVSGGRGGATGECCCGEGELDSSGVWVYTRSIDVAVFGGAVFVCVCVGKRGFFRRKILSVYAAAPPER